VLSSDIFFSIGIINTMSTIYRPIDLKLSPVVKVWCFNHFPSKHLYIVSNFWYCWESVHENNGGNEPSYKNIPKFIHHMTTLTIMLVFCFPYSNPTSCVVLEFHTCQHLMK